MLLAMFAFLTLARTYIPIAKETNIFVAFGNVIEVNLVVKAGLVRDFTLARLDDILALYLEEDLVCREWTHGLDRDAIDGRVHDGKFVTIKVKD
jgi:hypothetical protein